MSRILKIIMILSLISLPRLVRSQTSELDFLRTGPNTVSLALGEAVTSIPLGGSALYTNPANLVLEPSSSLSADYTLWVADIRNSHLAVNFRRQDQAFAFGILNSSSSDFEARNTPGPSDGDFSVTHFSLSGGYARSVKNFSVGVAAQFIREEFYVNSAAGYAVSAGISSIWLEGKFKAAASVVNIGRMNKLHNQASELPAGFRGGVTAEIFRFFPSGEEELSLLAVLTAEYNQPLKGAADFSGERAFNFGISLEIAETIEIRGGYKTGEIERPAGFGVGINLESIHFNYALIPFSTGYGTAHSVGLQYYF